MSQQKFVTYEIVNLLKDNKPHSIKDVKDQVEKHGLKLSKDSTVIRSVLSKMCRTNQIQKVGRGVYASLQYEDNKSFIDQTENDPPDKQNAFTTFVPPFNKTTILAVTVLENGHINLNGKLNAEIISRNITIQFNPSFRQIKLIVDGPTPHKFTKAGTTINQDIKQQLKRHRITIPARYVIQRTKDDKCFIGKLDL